MVGPTPDTPPRFVLLVCGPPGAGKTTRALEAAAVDDLDVYDRDDRRWADEAAFVAALIALRADPHARAVVIRSGARLATRHRWAGIIGATTVLVVDTDPATCKRRILLRARPHPPLDQQLAAVDSWWARYQPPTLTPTATSRPW